MPGMTPRLAASRDIAGRRFGDALCAACILRRCPVALRSAAAPARAARQKLLRRWVILFLAKKAAADADSLTVDFQAALYFLEMIVEALMPASPCGHTLRRRMPPRPPGRAARRSAERRHVFPASAVPSNGLFSRPAMPQMRRHAPPPAQHYMAGAAEDTRRPA